SGAATLRDFGGDGGRTAARADTAGDCDAGAISGAALSGEMAICGCTDAAIGVGGGTEESAARCAGVVLAVSARKGRCAAVAGNWRDAKTIAFGAGGGRIGLQEGAQRCRSCRGLCRTRAMEDAVRAAASLFGHAG